MTDDVAPPAAPIEPTLWLDGQPWSPSMAVKAMAEFDADKDKVAAALGGDVSKQQERRNYWLMARGHQPGGVPVMPQDGTGVAQQMNEREQQIQEAKLAAWEKHIRMDDAMRFEAKRGLATQQQVDEAKREIRRMLDDKSFGARVLANDMDAMDRWARFNLIASMKVAPADYDWSQHKRPE
jgi:hypothetical protein